jgi:transcriptional regulator GlxA family with amidase domain
MRPTPRSATLFLVVTQFCHPIPALKMSDSTSQQPSTNGAPNGTTKHPLFEIQGKHPVHYGVLLFPGFQALDVFGPLDVFNSLSMLYHFPIKMTMLAKTSGAVETSHQRAGKQMFSHPETDCSQSMQIDRTFEEQLNIQETGGHRDNGKGAIDVLIVPGGVGTRNDMTAEIDFIKRMYPSLKAVLSVCTGSTLLARAGILDGRRATTNKRAWEWATSNGPNVNWVGEARWVVDGNITTGSGVSAGIDATYAFVSDNYGETIAQELADSAEYVRWIDADHDPFAKRWNVEGAKDTVAQESSKIS